MKFNKPLLIIVDYQNDYVDQKGKLAKTSNVDLTEHRNILPYIKNLIKIWHNAKNPVLFIMSDYNVKYYKGHYKEYRMSSAYGNTALRGTWGHKLYNIMPNNKDRIIACLLWCFIILI